MSGPGGSLLDTSLGELTMAVAGLPGAVTVAAFALLDGIPVWAGWYWLARYP